MSNRSAARVLSLFQKFATNLASELPISPKEASHPQPTNSVLGALQLASNEDLDDVWSWNGTVPENVQARVHDLIAQQTLRQPDSQAVCAWDGDWTYAQLDTLSTRLAYHLVEMGVGPKVIVPLCFEKSKWTPVAMLGVMKAGGASVAMDTAQPEERLRSIVSQVSPVVVLSSSSKKDLAGRLAGETPVQVVAEDLSPTASFAYDRPLPEVSPSDPMYLVFTSGSTGMPKGVVVTHANIASAIRHQRHALGFTPTSRVYDFASYMFDVVWCDFYQALSIGGCLCIPGDHERTADFIGGIDRLSANIVIFTPSTVRGLEPGALNHLKNLHFIGEPLYIDAFHQVEPHVSITNLYGPSECTTFATAQNVVGRNMQAVGIGHGIGLNTWVVDPVTGLSLMPVGGTGELWLEGPLVTDGYLRDPEKTAAAFVEDPSWLLEGSSSHPGRRGRLYKTGDLVRWNEDGSLTFVGRKDTQVKINGQRVELGEIEHVLRASLSQDIQQVVAEVIIPQHSGRITLVAFIELSDPAAQTMTESELFALAAGATKGMEEKLSSRLPAHMTPSFYIPLPRIPVTATGKTDRKGLREIGKSLTEEQLEALNPSDHERRQPRTAMERKLQLLWSSVLKLDIGKVGADDSFLRLGGDSISAMRLVSAARTEGLSFSVADIFMHPRLSELASSISPSAEGLSDIAVVDKLSLLSPNIDVAAAITEAAALCGVIESQVEDLYPCTPLQEGMLALTAIRPGDYIARCAFELQPSVDMDRFQKAWEEVFASTPILRTRVIDLTGQGLVQAVIDEAPHWMSDKERYETCPTMGLGGTLVRAGLIRKDRPNGKNIFLLTIHHALYDGWSLGMLLGRLEKAYLGQELRPLPDYRSFVKHATSIDEELATEFWRRQLSGSEAEAFPPMPSPAHQSKSDQVMIHHINNLKWGKGDITPSTAVRTALSILIADYSGVEDVVFGATVTGRQANIPGIEDMIGPAIATVPIRVTVDSEQQLHQFLLQVQAQSIEMTAFEQMGLQRIRRLGADAARACQFQTLLVVQPAEETAEWESEIIARDIHDVSDGGQGQLQEVETYALTVECDLGDNGLRLKIGFDSGVMGEKQVQRLVQQFEHILQQIVSSTDTMAVADLQGLNQHDLRDIWSWNATVPETVDVCVHDRIANTVSKQPDSTAVCAWDGDWTYQELDDLSTFLAYKLKRLGVGPDVIVPLCFEKSKWMPVAMLGVMKAGGASVAIDTAQPEARLQSIVQQANPIVVLCSVAKEELAKRFASNVLVVNRGDILLATSMPGNWPALPKISPSSRLYIVFTSGSTGTPKGVVITHSNFSSAITHQRTAQGISPSSRIYDFASYAFDVAWANALTCFESGACLCIPSDADRKDDLNGSIARLKPTHADVTPSAALVLSPESLRQLRTMTVGGERLTAEWARRWSTHVGLKNSYGPSECTPTASFTEVIDPNVPFMGSIGRGAGLNTWVVDAATGESLVAIGSPGELWLEGPLVGAGYLGDPKKTASAFVDNPSWLLRGAGPGHPPRRGRLYKTGDLVRYNQDGSLTFVGRKDTQVKINGQRVELDEIENHMARHDATRQAACLIPASGPCAKRLVGIFSLKGLERDQTDKAPIQLIEGTDASQAEDYIQAANSLLGDSLPAYMVPSIWIALRDLPMTASGKLDRKELNTWLCNMDLSTYKKVANREGGDETHREPQTDAERVLLDACSHVLNMPLFSIDLNRSFISNGGDSISAMRLSSYCRAANVTLSVAGLLKSKSLADFAQSLTVAATVAQPAAQAEDFDVPFTLSPIQQWFFTQGPVTEPDYYFNQGFYVKLRRHFSVAEIENAMTTLVHHHSMLRARFQTVDGTWTQRVLKPGDGVHHFASRQVSDIAEVASLAMQRQRSLDIQNGPVFTADLCSLPARNSSSPEEQFLILIAHHLVVDLVSWRIILDDLETVLTGGTMQSSLSFQTWNKLQQSYASSSELSPE
jgi:amino acid adenylation domain-containing protein